MWQGEGVGCGGGGGFEGAGGVSCEQDAPSIESKKSQNGVKNESKKSQKRVKTESKRSQKRVRGPKDLKRVKIESKWSQNRVKIKSKPTQNRVQEKRPCSVEPPPSNLHEGCTGSSLLSGEKDARAYLSAQRRRGVSLGVAQKGREGG